MKKKKFIIIFCIVLFIVLLYLFIDSLIFNNMKENDQNKSVRINYLVVDYDKTKNIKFDKRQLYSESIVENYVTTTNLKLKGNYYYAKADNINENYYKGKFVWAHFAMNDVDAIIPDDCHFNYSNKTIKIHKKYFNKKLMKQYKNVPIKVELLSRLKKDDYQRIKVNGSVRKILTHKNNIKVINEDETPQLTLFNKKNGYYINDKDFKLYINDKKQLISKDYYSYNPKSGVLSLNFPAFYMKNFTVVYKKSSLIKNILLKIVRPMKKVEAATTTKKLKGTMTPASGTDLSDYKNAMGTITVSYYYQGSCGYYHDGSLNDGNGAGCKTIPNKISKSSISISPTSSSDKSNADFYIKVNKFTVTNDDGDKLKVNLAGSFQWLRLYCDGVHNKYGNKPSKLVIDVKVTNVDGNKVTFDLHSRNNATTQYADGKFYMDKKTVKLYKIVLQKGHPTAEAPDVNTAWGKSGIVFRLYSSTCTNNSNCGNLVAEKSTDSKGRVTFNNLEEGTYWVKEIYNEYALSSSLSGNGYYRDAHCDGVNMSSSDPDNEDKVLKVCAGSYCYEGNLQEFVANDEDDPNSVDLDEDDSVEENDDSSDDNSDDDDYQFDNSMIGDFYPYCNVKKHYAAAIKKVDYDTNEKKSGFTFNFSNGVDTISSTTNSDGIATFCGIKNHFYFDQDEPENSYFRGYSITETDQLANYWGPLSNPVLSSSSSSTPNLVSYAFNKGCSSITPSVVGTAKNNRKFYCMKVKKVDKDTGKVLTGAEFEATGSGLTLNKNSSLTYGSSKNIYQESNGVTTFLTSIYDSPFSIRETKAPEGYAASTDVKSVTPTLINQNKSWSEIGFSDCSANADTFTYEDTALTINWFKINEDGHQINSKNPKELNGAEFKVRNSSGQYITVSEPGSETDPKSFTTDTTGKQKLCYTYTGTSNSGSTMYSMNTRTKASKTSPATDTNGEVCVRGLPEGDYTIEEIRPAHYHTFGNTKYKNIKTYKDFRNRIVNESDFTNSGKSIYGDNTYINEETDFEFDKSVLNKDSSQEGDTKYTITKNGVTKTMSLSELTTEELKLITFRIFDSNGTVLSFVQKTDDKGTYYDFVGNTLDGPGTSGATTDLHLDNGRNFRVKHLDWGNYSVREVDSSNCQINTSGYNSFVNPSSRPASAQSCSNSSGGGSGDCIGYYSPDYSSDVVDKFYISECTSDLAYSCGKYGRYKKGLENKPTEVTLTKKDFYHYDDSADIIDKDRKKDSKESQAEFENDKERSDFDRIDFKVKDPSGNYLNFIYLGKSGDCKSDSSYSIYRYTPGLSLQPGIDPDTFNSEIGGTTQTLHACGGHIKILNLCRGNKYTFEEVKVPDDSVYVLENSTDTPTSTCFTIPCTEGEPTPSSETHIINDKGTRIRFEKRDSKYNYLIPDETVTFRVYRCPKGMSKEECHPSQFGTIDSNNGKLVIDESKITENGYKLMKFSPRAILNNDREDGAYSNNVNTAKAENVENNYQVYLAMSDSDSEKLNECSNDLGDSNCYVTNLHPDHGVLILRYLQATGNAEYNYVLVETASPKNYLLPVGTDGETPFTISNQTVKIDSVDDPNVPTALLIKKYSSETGNLLAGAEFKIYKAEHSCDANLKPWAQTPLTELKLKTIKDGVYEARPEEDTSIVKTCTDLDGFKCSDIPVNPTTKLTYGIDTNGNNTATNILNENINNQYVDSYADFKNLKTEDDKSLLLQEGEALIQYLEYNTCYVIEEVKAPEGHSLPSKKNDRFTMIEIKENEQFGKSTEFTFKNTPTPFTFYKFDEYNQLLDGAEFKLQKLNDDKIYEDIAVEKVEKEDGSLFYKALGLLKKVENGETAITTKNGSATVYYLTAGQYRILETKPAPGKTLNKNPNIATFFVDDSGNTYGESIITNKPGTIQSSSVSPASAKLVVNIQTGMVVIKYGFIITLIIAIIAGLMLLKRKTK